MRRFFGAFGLLILGLLVGARWQSEAGAQSALRPANAPAANSWPEASPFASADDAIVDDRRVWVCEQPVLSTDLVRYQGEWICVVETEAGLRILGSEEGGGWRPLSTLASAGSELPLRAPQLGMASDGRLMLSAVAPDVPRGGRSRSWFSYDAVKWSPPRASAEPGYLVSDVVWHVGVAYNVQSGSHCGNATTLRIGTSGDHGETFRTKFEDTLSDRWPGEGALVFSQDDGYCVMRHLGKNAGGALGHSRAPFTIWEWKPLPGTLVHPNAIRARSGRMLVAACLADGRERMVATLFELDPEAMELRSLGNIPADPGPVGLARHGDEVYLSYHRGTAVHLARVSIEPWDSR